MLLLYDELNWEFLFFFCFAYVADNFTFGEIQYLAIPGMQFGRFVLRIEFKMHKITLWNKLQNLRYMIKFHYVY